MSQRIARIRNVVLALLLAAGLPAAAQTPAEVEANGTALTESYYRTILGREPDASGVAFWTGVSRVNQSLGANAAETWRAMAVQFFASPEYAGASATDGQFVDDLYATFLGRAADGPGHAYWTGLLQRGLPREAILVSFLFSPEFNNRMERLFGATAGRAEVDMVVDFYRGFLNRLPDADGFRYWRTRFRAAQCTSGDAIQAEAAAISSQFLASAEYTQRLRTPGQFVADLYNAFLRRGSDADGFEFWSSLLESGAMTSEQVRAQFGQSPEFQARILAVLMQGCAKAADESDLLPALGAVRPSPFIAFVEMQGRLLDRVTGARFTVLPRPGTVSRPVQVRSSTAALAARGHALVAPGTYRVPVFGLYADHGNTVSVELTFDDGSSRATALTVASGPYVDATGYYNNITALKTREAGTLLDYDFFYIRSIPSAPVVIDTDGHVRWWTPAPFGSAASLLRDGDFYIGKRDSMEFLRVGRDGAVTSLPTIAGPYTNFHHNIEPGKVGMLVQLDGLYEDGVTEKIESVIVEVDRDGNTLKTWDLGAIFSAYMAAEGDDPSLFVIPGVDWLHTNAVTYDARDDSLIVSGRETFLVKIDYATGAIKWILGDPTKHWFTFPSLQARALTLEPGGYYPIGQHATSVTKDGLVMVFNNGRNSQNNPPGTSAGANYTFSMVSGYAIDEAAGTAREVLHFDYGQSIYSQFCSSAYEHGESLLVSYAMADNMTKARLVGLDDALDVVFDFQMPNAGCNASYNAVPLDFHDLVLQ